MRPPVFPRATPSLRGVAVCLLAACAGSAWAQDVGRIVVRYKPTVQAASVSAEATAATMSQRANALATRAGVRLKTLRTTGSSAAVFETRDAVDEHALRAMALRIAQDPTVLSAEPDVRVAATSNDTYFSMQWALGAPAAKAGAGNFAAAWAYSTGADVVVAVLDTGMTAHPDLEGRQFAGYDFVSDTTMGADGNGRDADPTDPGDACASSGSTSSWHGTAVASQIAAIADNGYGIAGGAPGARIQQVRVLGKCGGWLSDTSDAIAWLAGRSFAGIPAPSVRPKVINLSLGGGTSCPSYMQDAINLANAAGIVVIAAAGNDGAATISAPANCSGVIAVAASTATGDLASYSNYSSQVAITAPGGGQCRQATAGCDTTPTIASGVDGSSSFVGYTPARYFAGTSAATPHVSAAAALLLAYSPSLTPAQVRSALLSGARPFPAGSFCTTAGRCGSGLLDASRSLATLAAPLVTITPTAGVTTGSNGVQAGLVARGASATLKAAVPSGSGYSYAWQQASGTAATIVSGRTAETLAFTAPATAGLISFTVTATSPSGVTARNTVSLRVNSAPDTLPASLPEAMVGTAYSKALPTTDGDGDTLSFALVSGPTGLTVSPAGVVAWPAPVLGSYSVTIAARDPFGQTTQRAITLTVKAKVAPPVVPGGTLSARVGTAFSAATGVTGPSGVAISYALAGQPAGLTISSAGVLSWAAPVAGSYSIRVTATNAGGSASGVYALTVKPANRAPAIIAKSYTAVAGTKWTGQVTASDADGDVLRYELISGVPAGMTINATGLMSWAAPVAGTYKVGVRAADPSGASSVATMALVVSKPNTAPTMDSRSYPATANVAFAAQLQARDAEGDALTYSLSGSVPAGLTLSTAGRLSWAKPVRGSWTVTVRVADARGAAMTTTLKIVVN